MTELFRQLAFINAILGGFAITFLSVLLTTHQARRIVNWMILVTTGAAVCLVLSAMGATFSAVVASYNPDGQLPEDVDALYEPISILFLIGTLLLFTLLGLGGWVRSPKMGYATTFIAVLAFVLGIFILLPFITVS